MDITCVFNKLGQRVPMFWGLEKVGQGKWYTRESGRKQCQVNVLRDLNLRLLAKKKKKKSYYVLFRV